METLRRMRRLAPMLTAKAKHSALSTAGLSAVSPTRREGKVSGIRQKIQWAQDATEVWIPAESLPKCCIVVGSSFNAAASDVWELYSGIVNCCPCDYKPKTIENVERYVEVDVQDTNCANLDHDELQKAFDLLQITLKDDRDLLVHCNMGASRSVAVTIYLLGRHTKQFDYKQWHDRIQRERPYINVSVTLRHQVEKAWKPFKISSEDVSELAQQETLHAPTADAGH